MLNSHAVRAIKNRQAIITQDRDYPEIYKGFRIEYNENLQRYEGRGEVSYVASSWDKLKKLIDDFWAGKDKQSGSKTSDYRGYKVTDQIIKGFMIYKSGKNPNTYYAKNENGEEYEGTMEEIKKKIDAYWMKRDEDVMKQKVNDAIKIVSYKGYEIIKNDNDDKFRVFLSGFEVFVPQKSLEAAKALIDKKNSKMAVRNSFGITEDARARAPKGGITIKGKEFAGGEFIPTEGGYAEAFEKMKKEKKASAKADSVIVSPETGGYDISVFIKNKKVKAAWKSNKTLALQTARDLADFYRDDNGQSLNIVTKDAKTKDETLWEYEDGAGVKRQGYVEKFVDHGGTDVTYFFRRKDGNLDVVSGSRLKNAKVISRDSKTKDARPKHPRWRIKDDKMFKLKTAAKKMKDSKAKDAASPALFDNDFEGWKGKAESLGYEVKENKTTGLWEAKEGIEIKGTYNKTKGGRLYLDSKAKDNVIFMKAVLQTKEGKKLITKPVVANSIEEAKQKMRNAIEGEIKNGHLLQGEIVSITSDTTMLSKELETTDDLFYKGVYYKPQELHALLVKESMTKKLNELTESEKRARKGNAWPLYESNGGVFAVVN